MQFYFIVLMDDEREIFIILQLILVVFLFYKGLLNGQCVVGIDPDQALIRKEIFLCSFLEVVPVVVQDTDDVRHRSLQDID